MIDFKVVPYKEVTVRSYMKYKNVNEFANAITAPIQRGQLNKMGNLFWANGILFRHYTYSPSDVINNEYLNRHLPLDHIEYAPMPQFKNEIESNDIIVTLIDVSNHILFNDLTKWIKSNLEKKSK